MKDMKFIEDAKPWHPQCSNPKTTQANQEQALYREASRDAISDEDFASLLLHKAHQNPPLLDPDQARSLYYFIQCERNFKTICQSLEFRNSKFMC